MCCTLQSMKLIILQEEVQFCFIAMSVGMDLLKLSYRQHFVRKFISVVCVTTKII